MYYKSMDVNEHQTIKQVEEFENIRDEYVTDSKYVQKRHMGSMTPSMF